MVKHTIISKLYIFSLLKPEEFNKGHFSLLVQQLSLSKTAVISSLPTMWYRSAQGQTLEALVLFSGCQKTDFWQDES